MLPFLYSTGYMHSTISLIWAVSKFFMKSLSKTAFLMSSLVLEEQKWELEKLIEDEDEMENRKNQNNEHV